VHRDVGGGGHGESPVRAATGDHPGSRADASTDEIRDVLWTYHSPEIYELLVVERGWSAGQYGTFIGQAMIDAVLNPGR
jgi:hypothetical protein